MVQISLKDIIEEFHLEIITHPEAIAKKFITSSEVNRSGLALTGHLEHFCPERIQILGIAEIGYLEPLSPIERQKRLNKFFEFCFPCVVVTSGLEIFPEIIEASQKYSVPILRTSNSTSKFMSALLRILNFHLAPMISRHAVLVEVFGEGVLILGESGIGKSETALELVKRGHRLIADDSVEIRKVSDKTLVGSCPEILRYFIEIRGIGILDVKQLFGVGSVKASENINLVTYLYFDDKYDRLKNEEIEKNFTNILDIQVPLVSIPVKPGKNLAITIEVAALKNRQKKLD